MLDKAKLLLSNVGDMEIEISTQSEQCYRCSPWYVLSLAGRTNATLVVNSTYLTHIFIEQAETNSSYSFDYHFTQNGLYSVRLNSTSHEAVRTLDEGSNEYLSLLISFIIYLSTYFIWRVWKYAEKCRNSGGSSEPEALIEDNPTANVCARAEESPENSVSSRINAVDTFRGLSIVLMIFVNYGGGKFYFFRHAPWNGLTIADLVFPWFMWIMGVSLAVSFASLRAREVSSKFTMGKILKRSFILFKLGIFINSLKSNNIYEFRVMGVLQRFSFCYLVTGMMEVISWSAPELIRKCRNGLYMLIFWSIGTYLTFRLSVPGCPTGYIGPGGVSNFSRQFNCTGGAAGYIDRMLLGRHIYQHPSSVNVYGYGAPFDPEGIVGSIQACLTVQLGLIAGRILISNQTLKTKLSYFVLWGVVLGLLSGILCGWSREEGSIYIESIPINKNLWSLPFVAATGSFAFFIMSFLHFLDTGGYWKGGVLRITGLNAIVLYIGHEITKKALPFTWTPVPATHSWHLAANLWSTSLWVIIAICLHKKNIYIKV